MFRRIILPLLLLFVYSFAFSQFSIEKNTACIKDVNGSWHFTAYATNIVKVVYSPTAYLHNELLSDAVIVQPLQQTPKKIDHQTIALGNCIITLQNDTIYLGKDKQCILAGSFSNMEFSGFRFALHNNEKIFGGGERAIPLNRRGYRFNLYNNPWYGYSEGADNLNYSVPFITSSNKYALFFDNPAKGYLDIGKTNPNLLEYGICSGELNFYIITGNDYPEILQSYFRLTSTQPLPPRWAMGNFMSRFGYTSQQQAKDIYTQMQAEKVPFDAVIFDLFWFGDSIKHTLGNLDWVNKTKWPNPQQMIADLQKDGVKTILVTEPFILEGTKSYNSFKPFLAVDSMGKTFTLTDFYFGQGGLIDIFRTDAKNKFWTYYKKQMDIGVEGWWGDLGEPEKHPSTIYHNLQDLGYKRLFNADEVHNIYGHNWTKMLYQQFAKDYPNKRLFSLNRSGFAGTQRYSIFPWSGDVSRSWSGFRAQLPIMLGMSMSGVPYIHADAGGFAGGEGDKELYVRWLQFAQYTPIFRPHGTALFEADPNAFSFPSEIALIDTPYRKLAREVAVQRYKMLPYNYTLTYNQAAKAEPLVSPLYYYYGTDTTATNIGDEFMFGKNLLIAPVLEKAATNKQVYLPKGAWYALNNNSIIQGQQWIQQPVGLQQMPVFVKAGSIIPQLPDSLFISNTNNYTTKNIYWHYYASSEASEGYMYDDDGSSKNAIKTGKYEIISVKAIPQAKSVQFNFTSTGGNFNGKPAIRHFKMVLHGLTGKYNAYNHLGQKIMVTKDSDGNLTFNLTFTGNKANVVLKAE
ncbi:TIM-barrel domain-containing protein [Limnovirga soli]|uniref:DUF5110 domain-containing protein n=1 Tax=Limnovirga soli TaxID=2656915 RepID=A0A8J8JTU9_9BACT|nr:TIM-barrel domain-containing protein [Limnovirga soli]NNV56358.1 DUF5110 domain-containing protein [Limnovirga soli]